MTGEIKKSNDKSQSYKISEVHIAKLSEKHIPYFMYAIVIGPKGGKYLIDIYNIEQIAFYRNDYNRAYNIDAKIRYYAMRNGIAVIHNNNVNCDEQTLLNIAKNLKIPAIIRKRGRSEYYRLLHKLDLSWLDQA